MDALTQAMAQFKLWEATARPFADIVFMHRSILETEPREGNRYEIGLWWTPTERRAYASVVNTSIKGQCVIVQGSDLDVGGLVEMAEEMRRVWKPSAIWMDARHCGETAYEAVARYVNVAQDAAIDAELVEGLADILRRGKMVLVASQGQEMALQGVTARELEAGRKYEGLAGYAGALALSCVDVLERWQTVDHAALPERRKPKTVKEVMANFRKGME